MMDRAEQSRPAGEQPRMRADARRNREQIMAAAREVFADHGPDAALEEVARRAGVGIATLYRRFPDRPALLRAVALDIWLRVGHEARTALAEEPEAFRALGRYMHRALDLRIGAVLPALVKQLPIEKDAELRHARAAIIETVQQIIDNAQAEGTLRPDVVFSDIGMLIVRLARPLLDPLAREIDDRLAHRHLDLVIDGLRATPDRPAAALPASVTLADLWELSSGQQNG